MLLKKSNLFNEPAQTQPISYLLKIDYSIRCFIDRDAPYYAYKLAREHTFVNQTYTESTDQPTVLP